MARIKHRTRSTGTLATKPGLAYLYHAVGKLYVELSACDDALRLLENKLDDGFQTSAIRDSYYDSLRRRSRLKAQLDASIRETRSRASRPPTRRSV
jgi:hypothetical protein